ASFLESILEELNEDELAIFKRGRNSKSMPTKNTDKAHYSKATGFEAVLGFLYVSGQDERLLYILNKCYSYINERRK
ncbi:MAG: Mini-ribonuclease 3, partial [Clostridia bacterium]|nr:Mini-ribonuclease 3 [Clostridia bacterium]